MSLFLELLLQVPYHEIPSCVSKLLPISLHLSPIHCLYSHTLCTVVWFSCVFVRHDVIVPQEEEGGEGGRRGSGEGTGHQKNWLSQEKQEVKFPSLSVFQ